MLSVLLVMILFFSVLTYIPYAHALCTSLSGRSSSPPLLPPIRSISLAINHRLHMGLPPMEMDVWWSFFFLVSSLVLWAQSSTKDYIKFPARPALGTSWRGWVRVSIPWQTPTVPWRNSPIWMLKRTALLEFSYSAQMAWISPSMLELFMTCHRPACQTLAKRFLEVVEHIVLV